MRSAPTRSHRARDVLLWTPREACEFYAPARVEAHAFAFEQRALQTRGVGLGALTDFTARVHDALPRNPVRVLRTQRVQRVTDEARVARQPGEPRDLPVTRNPRARNAPHHFVNALPL